jgi:hypothetical protein
MDQIYKLQPHLTLALQGFHDYGAAAALWGASDTGFTVSTVFRDMADFAVLVLFQKDDPFGHPLFSYLPDGDLTGLVLDFDVTWQGSLELAVDFGQVESLPRGLAGAAGPRREQQLIESPVIVIFRQRPTQTGCGGLLQVSMDGRLTDQATAGDLVLSQTETIFQT